MGANKETFYLIRSDILPESIQKAIEAKKILERGDVETIQEAVDKVGLSRSAFYKYKDAVFPFNAMMKQKIMTVSLNLEHRSGILSQMLSFIASRRGNVLTINQTIPIQGLANVVLTIETAQMDLSATELSEELRHLDGVQKVILVGQG
ncbi:ACT domain-containing protein [Caldalkalibacillus mannanilyticus]|uniref:ACT domain-containing protein n=1 Tax=Caldalkalibacillus mannanilyticus TaxID=1418 RepID=UPI0004691EA4|nr:ACT domain-containing protein [Caldalkalibacillus mannanilyticus]